MTATVEVTRESQIAAGTVLIGPAELAPRIGLGTGPRGLEKVRARARAGLIPCHRPNARVYLFHWPTVVAAIASKVVRPRKGPRP